MIKERLGLMTRLFVPVAVLHAGRFEMECCGCSVVFGTFSEHFAAPPFCDADTVASVPFRKVTMRLRFDRRPDL